MHYFVGEYSLNLAWNLFLIFTKVNALLTTIFTNQIGSSNSYSRKWEGSSNNFNEGQFILPIVKVHCYDHYIHAKKHHIYLHIPIGCQQSRSSLSMEIFSCPPYCFLRVTNNISWENYIEVDIAYVMQTKFK